MNHLKVQDAIFDGAVATPLRLGFAISSRPFLGWKMVNLNLLPLLRPFGSEPKGIGSSLTAISHDVSVEETERSKLPVR